MAKIKIDAQLYERIKKVAALAGYASAEEFIIHVIEKELATIDQDGEETADEQVIERLRGLGYLE